MLQPLPGQKSFPLTFPFSPCSSARKAVISCPVPSPAPGVPDLLPSPQRLYLLPLCRHSPPGTDNGHRGSVSARTAAAPCRGISGRMLPLPGFRASPAAPAAAHSAHQQMNGGGEKPFFLIKWHQFTLLMACSIPARAMAILPGSASPVPASCSGHRSR